MKRVISLALLLLSGMVSPCGAADADKQDIEERFARLNSAVETLLASNASLQRRVDQLTTELRAVREDQSQASTNAAFQMELQRLVLSLREVDQKREADKQLILGQLEKIGKAIAEQNAARPVAKTSPPPPRDPPAAPQEDDYEYEVKPGDRLLDIIKVYNVEFRKNHLKPVTTKEVIEANPGIKPDLLRAKQKIRIPARPPE